MISRSIRVKSIPFSASNNTRTEIENRITKINRLHESCLRIVSNDKRSWFNILLKKDGSVWKDERNIKIMATKIFKLSKNQAPPQMHDILKLKHQSHYNLRYNSLFSRPLVKSVYEGTGIYLIYNQTSGIYYRILTRICLI